jgi:hypothetical protein
VALMSWRYWGLPDGREFRFATEPLFECPQAAIVYEVWDPSKPVGSEKTITRRRPEEAVGVTHTRHVTAEAQAAADALGVDPKKLLGMLTAAHRRNGLGVRARVDGRLTDRCDVCGARMERKGYMAAVWEPTPEEELGDSRSTVELNRHLNPGYVHMRPVKVVYLDTRREAKQWAYDEYATAKAVVEEAKS